jgi:hypothetical protein
MTCRICLEDGNTINVCGCSGTQGKVHLKCIRRWHEQTQCDTCELCLQRYDMGVVVHYERCVFLAGVVLNAMHGLLLWTWRAENTWFVLCFCFLMRIVILCDYEIQTRSSLTTAAGSVIAWYGAYIIALFSVYNIKEPFNETILIDVGVETLMTLMCLYRTL